MKRLCCLIIFTILHPAVGALTFPIKKDFDLIGRLQYVKIVPGDTVSSIAREFNVGVLELIEANQKIDYRKLKVGSKLLIPSQFILPEVARVGIVINLPEMRLYYFYPAKNLVSTFPIGIGRIDWTTPLGKTSIIERKANPTWTPPASIRRIYENSGKFLPKVVPAGPKNPLGNYALRLGIPGYLIHGTNMPQSIGLRSSSGCIRMFPEDIKTLFHIAKVGTKVHIIHDAYKIGRHNNKLYLEAHEPLLDELYGVTDLKNELVAYDGEDINWHQATKSAKKTTGYPAAISD